MVLAESAPAISSGFIVWICSRSLTPCHIKQRNCRHSFQLLKMEDCQNAMHLVFPDGRTYTGADAFRKIFLRMPLMFPVGLILSIPPIPWLLRRLYPLLARNRNRLGGHCEVTLPSKSLSKTTQKSQL